MDSENSWTLNLKDVDAETFNLSVKNPHKKDEAILRELKVILDEIEQLDNESNKILMSIRKMI